MFNYPLFLFLAPGFRCGCKTFEVGGDLVIRSNLSPPVHLGVFGKTVPPAGVHTVELARQGGHTCRAPAGVTAACLSVSPDRLGSKPCYLAYFPQGAYPLDCIF